MKKKKVLSPSSASIAPVATPILSPSGKKLLLAGVFLAVSGFVILTFTDPAGENWASFVSPLLLVVGYTCMGFGLVTKSPQ